MKNHVSEPFANSPFESRSIAQILWRHKKKIILLPLVSLGLGALVIFFFPRTYRSEAKIFLQVGHESVGLDPTATTGQTISLMQSGRENEVKSAIELLIGRAVISKTVERLTPDYVLGKTGPGAETKSNPVAEAVSGAIGSVVGWVKGIDPISPAEEAAIRIGKNLEVVAERGSAVIVCRYEAKSPVLAQKVLETLVDEYRQEHVRIHRNQNSLDFFVNQRDELRDVLDGATAKLRDAKNSLGLSSIEGRRGSLERELRDVELQKFGAQQELAAATARAEELERQLTDEPALVMASKRLVPNAGADLMRDKLYQLRIKEKDLRARYSEDHPVLKALLNQVAEAQQVVDEEETERPETTNRINEIHRALMLELRQKRAEIAGLDSRMAAADEQRANISDQLLELNRNEVLVKQLEVEENVARNTWTKYTDNLEQARIDREREQRRVTNLSVAQAPTLAEKPVSPSIPLVALASLALAVGWPAVTILGAERLEENRRQRKFAAESFQNSRVERLLSETAHRPMTPK